MGTANALAENEHIAFVPDAGTELHLKRWLP
jgi:hypothetical protein